MKVEVKIIFNNIQSHEETVFSFKPGMNFIVSADNNVGKSTIFAVLNTMARMPNVGRSEYSDLLRSGAHDGGAHFIFGDERVSLWLVAEAGGGGVRVVRGFIEYVSGGKSVRMQGPPDIFYEGMGIHVSKAGGVVNIIDANNVQLFVDGGAATDGVVSEILIDDDVERAKENLAVMYKYAGQDVHEMDVHIHECDRYIQNNEYNDSVDEFANEVDFLEDAAVVVDLLGEAVLVLGGDGPRWGLSELDEMIEQLREVRKVLTCCEVLDSVVAVVDDKCVMGSDGKGVGDVGHEWKVFGEEAPKLRVCLQYLVSIAGASDSLKRIRGVVSEGVGENGGVGSVMRCYDLMRRISTARWAIDDISENKLRYSRALDEIKVIKDRLDKEQMIVDCPVRGKVYYGECVPVEE